MHTIVNLVENDCGIAFLYKTAANESLKKGYIRELKLSDFSMKHNFDFAWDKNSIYADITLEFAKKTHVMTGIDFKNKIGNSTKRHMSPSTLGFTNNP